MPRLRLPQLARQGSKKLADLSDDKAAAFLDALQKIEPTVEWAQLENQLHRAVPQIAHRDIDEVFDALMSLSYGLVRTEWSIDDFIAQVIDEIDVKDDAKATARSRLKAFLTANAVTGSWKARDVTNEYQYLFLDARTVTDIRPIFGESASAGPVGASIMHTLKIRAHSIPEDVEFFVALDSADLKALQEVLSRAEAKSRSLRPLIDKLGLHLYGGEQPAKESMR